MSACRPLSGWPCNILSLDVTKKHPNLVSSQSLPRNFVFPPPRRPVPKTSRLRSTAQQRTAAVRVSLSRAACWSLRCNPTPAASSRSPGERRSFVRRRRRRLAGRALRPAVCTDGATGGSPVRKWLVGWLGEGGSGWRFQDTWFGVVSKRRTYGVHVLAVSCSFWRNHVQVDDNVQQVRVRTNNKEHCHCDQGWI